MLVGRVGDAALVGRVTSRNEQDAMEMEFISGRAGDREMSVVNGIECAAK